ncbi:MAG: hemolysin family protein [Betaproteobacteria bacterium]|jgi:putative hemolysin|nr:hemolysin family protein [Betaproteobacteria bacterium]
MEVLVLLALILANGVFAMSELAVVSSRHVRLRQLAEAKHPGAAAALALTAHPGQFLSTVQVGITLIGIFMGAFGEATLSAHLTDALRSVGVLAPYARELAVAIVVIGITYFSLVLGELVPKRLAIHAPEAVATRIAKPMQLLSKTVYPFVKLLTFSTEVLLRLLGVRERVRQTVTEAEIEGLMKIGTESGVFEPAEHEFVSRVLRLDSQTVSAIMTPRMDIVWLDVDAAREESLRTIRDMGFTRLPVCQTGPDDVLGILDTLDLLGVALKGETFDLRKFLRAPLYVPESIHLIRLLELFKLNKAHLALVVDEYGVVQGLVTMTDVIEAIVGEVPETDAPHEQEVVRRADGSLLVDGGISLDRLNEALERAIALPEDEAGRYHTLGGLVMARLGRVPRAGDQFDYAGLRFEVLDMDRHSVDKVLVVPQATRTSNAADADGA